MSDNTLFGLPVLIDDAPKSDEQRIKAGDIVLGGPLLAPSDTSHYMDILLFLSRDVCRMWNAAEQEWRDIDREDAIKIAISATSGTGM